MPVSSTVLGGRAHFIKIQIPATGSLPVSLATLFAQAGILNAKYAEVDGIAVDGATQRAAFQVASPRPETLTLVEGDFTNHAKYILPGSNYLFPPTDDLSSVYIRSLSTAIDAQFTVVC